MQNTELRQSHIAVIGAGFTGMVCALRLLKAGYRVTLLEQRADMGGLTATHNFGPFTWDRFYHCILTSDKALLGLLKDLDLEQELQWTKTEVGLFSKGTLHKMTSPADMLKYPHLSIFSKLRLGLMSVYVTHLKDGLRLEKLPLCQWTQRLFGKKVFEEFWDPLLRCKLGYFRHHASAAFLWGTLVRLSSTRESGPEKQECLGYVRGGYRTVFHQLQRKVAELRGETNLGVEIKQIGNNQQNPDEGAVRIKTRHSEMVFDAAVLTVPNRIVSKLLDTPDAGYRERLDMVMYLGIICTVLVLRRKLSPFYVTNITEKIGFTGVIEMTNLIDAEAETSGRHLVYLPHYTSPTDPLFNCNDEVVWDQLWPDVKRIFPDITEDDIESRFVFRERDVQPVPTIDYTSIVPPARTPVSNVYLANTAQIVNNTLNNNAMTSIAATTCSEVIKDIPVMRPVHQHNEFIDEPQMAVSL